MTQIDSGIRFPGESEEYRRERNRLLATVLFTGAILYALVGLAVMAAVSPPAIVAGAAFFLVGAVVGLINRLHREASAELAIEETRRLGRRQSHAPATIPPTFPARRTPIQPSRSRPVRATRPDASSR